MTDETNQLLTRVGPGTPMGELMRRHWIPAILSCELAEPDGPPRRVRLLGEDLVAFRDSQGRVGLLEAHCPHRRASLFFGRNEQGGLRCAYHGWKFSTSGECLDVPAESGDEAFRRRVRARAYPCTERNGVVWTFMGETPGTGEPLPPLPDLEWNRAPVGHSVLWRQLRHCNWLQCLEGDVDQFHQAILHSRLDDSEDDQQYVTVPGRTSPVRSGGAMFRTMRRQTTPEIETRQMPYGLMYASRRTTDDRYDYYRIRHFLFPFHTLVGGDVDAPEFAYNAKCWVPIDDTTTLVLESQFLPGRPWTGSEATQLLEMRNPSGFAPATSEPGGSWIPRANRSNDYLRDPELQRSTLFCGILSNPLQDTAVQESMGAIVDRTREHLCSADANIVQLRKLLAAAAVGLRDEGKLPAGAEDPAAYHCRPLGLQLAKGADWVAETTERRNSERSVGDRRKSDA
jgi:phenylpropionate dioxygenase-like ring-hydroxylating dioxygenase large terminal subunit